MILDISYFAQGLNLSGSNDANLLRAARSAKVGAKSGRLAKLTKLFKLLEQCWSQDHTILSNDVSAIPPAKQIARALSGVLSRRVAALVLTLILVTPLVMYQTLDFSYSAYIDTFDTLLTRINATATYERADWEVLADEFRDFYDDKDIQPMDLRIYTDLDEEWSTDGGSEDSMTNLFFDWSDSFGYIRPDAIIDVPSGSKRVVASFSLKPQLQGESLSSILTIMLVMVALVGFTASFQQAVDELIVMPMERMMDTLKGSANSILRSVQAIAHEKGHGEGVGGEDGFNADNIDGEVEEILETNILESMIEKLAKITSLILPGAETHYVNETNMDQSTKDWIANEYLNAETKESRLASQNFAPGSSLNARQTRITSNSPMAGKRSGVDGAIRATKFRKSKGTKQGEMEELIENSSGLSNAPRDVQMRRIEQLEREMNTWTFDVEELKVDETFIVLSMLFDTFEASEECNITHSTLTGFFKELQRRYVNTNTYHNWHHAVDVTHTVFRFVVETQAHTFLMPLETFSLLVSAVAHDVGHPGFSNPYLVKTKHELAIVHNDQSPLENMHCATLYEVVGNAKYDIFQGLETDQWRAVRKIVISAILGTDMIHHFPLISKMQVFYEMYGKELQNQIANGECNVETAPGMKEAANRSFMIDVFLHAADISNPVKSFDICKKWALLVVEEFFKQGDIEKSKGIDVSPMSDRLTTNINSMQVGFIEFVVFPLYDAFTHTFPTLQVLLQNCVNNDKEWTNRRVAEIKHEPEEVAKIQGRFESLRKKAEVTMEMVGAMAERIETQKQSYEDMIKIVNSASCVFSDDDDIELGTAPAVSGRSNRNVLLKNTLSAIDDGEYDELGEEDSEAGPGHGSPERKSDRRAGSRRQVVKTVNVKPAKTDGDNAPE
jgi:cAMP-specific phosphodiesterase 4